MGTGGVASRLRHRWPGPVVGRYYCYQATVTFGFFAPVFTLFLLDRGLSYTQIGLLGSVTAAVTVLGELPTGYVSDRFGHRTAVLLSSLLLAASIYGFLVAHSFAAFFVLWVLWGLGMALRSGAADAWLYDALAARGRSGAYTAVRGRGESVDRWTSAASMLVAGVLYELDPLAPFLAGGVLVTASVPVVLSLPAAEGSDRDGDAGDGAGTAKERFSIRAAAGVVRTQLTAPGVRSLVLYVALFFAVIAAANDFVQPVVTRRLGFPESSLGPLYAAFAAVSALGSYVAGSLEERFSTRGAVVFVSVGVAALALLPAVAPLLALPLFFAMRTGNAVLGPIASGYLNDVADSRGRATVLSAASMAYGLVRLPIAPLGGLVADATTPVTALAALGGGFLACAGLLSAWERPAGVDTGTAAD